MYAILVKMLDPFLLLMICVGVSIVWTFIRRATSPRAATTSLVSYLALYVACMPAVVHLAIGSLEWHQDWPSNVPAQREAIVVLGGYVLPDGSETDERLADDTLYRCLTAVNVYDAGDPCPVVLSGGKVDASDPGPPLAVAMESFLRRHGLSEAEILLEKKSGNTYENAVLTARMLKERNIQQVILVTDAYHMMRAAKCFRAQGIDVVPIGSRRRTPGFELSAWSFLPSSGAAQDLSRVAHEWLGLAWYWLRGRI